jgi:hypothetical protein
MLHSDDNLFEKWIKDKSIDPSFLEISRQSFLEACSLKNSYIDKLFKDYKKDMAQKNKEIEFLKSECKRVYDPIREFWNLEKNEEMSKLLYANSYMEQELRYAAYYASKDDVNGEAGNIAKDCLVKLGKGEIDE